MAPVVVYDACVLFSAPMRDLFLRMAVANIVTARWSSRILDECFSAILRQRPDLPQSALVRTRDLIIAAVPDCIVDGDENIASSIILPDDNDRHVVATALLCGAESIITLNLRDFPEESLREHSMRSVHPDAFVLEALDRYPDLMMNIVTEQAGALKNPPITVEDLLDRFSIVGLVESSARLRKLFRE